MKDIASKCGWVWWQSLHSFLWPPGRVGQPNLFAQDHFPHVRNTHALPKLCLEALASQNAQVAFSSSTSTSLQNMASRWHRFDKKLPGHLHCINLFWRRSPIHFARLLRQLFMFFFQGHSNLQNETHDKVRGKGLGLKRLTQRVTGFCCKFAFTNLLSVWEAPLNKILSGTWSWRKMQSKIQRQKEQLQNLQLKCDLTRDLWQLFELDQRARNSDQPESKCCNLSQVDMQCPQEVLPKIPASPDIGSWSWISATIATAL